VALRTLRRAMRLDGTCGLVSLENRKFDVSALTEPLPESRVEDAIQAAIDRGGTVPTRAALEAELLARGTQLQTLKLDAHLKNYRPRYDVRDKTSAARKTAATGGEDLVLRVSVLGHKDDKDATFELHARRDTLDTLADLVADFCAEARSVFPADDDDDDVFEGLATTRSIPRGDPRRRRKLVDFALGLGSPFVFAHGGKRRRCVHRLALTDAVLRAATETPAGLVFMKHDIMKLRSYKCDVCDAFTARTAVFDDPRQADDTDGNDKASKKGGPPTLFCDQCLHMFHYTAEGFLHPESALLSDPTQTDPPMRFYPLY